MRWRPAGGVLSAGRRRTAWPGNDLRAVSADGGASALAVTETRLCRLQDDGTAAADKGPSGEELRGLVTDVQGTTWVATSGGIYAHIPGGGWRLRYPGEAWRLTSDGLHPWAVTAAGLRRLDDGHALPAADRASRELGTVTALAAGPEDIVLATALGLWHWDGRGWRRRRCRPALRPAMSAPSACAGRNWMRACTATAFTAVAASFGNVFPRRRRRRAK